MAKFQVEQMVEIWVSTTVEAETMDEAIATAVAEDDWGIPLAIDGNWTEQFWVCNQATDQVWTDRGNGLMTEGRI